MSTSSNITICREQPDFIAAECNLKAANDALATAHSDYKAARDRGVSDLEAFLDKIDAAQHVVNEAERQFSAEKQRRDGSLGLSKLSVEVLQLIFVQCLGIPTDFACHNHVVARSALRARQLQPFILARVCRLWRGASVSYSRIWGSVELGGSFFSSPPRMAWINYISTVLLRSGNTALHIGLFEVYSQDNCGVLKELLPAMNRCTSLAFSGGLRYPCDTLLLLLSAQTPALQTLYLRDVDEHIVAPLILPYCPLLRTMHSLRSPGGTDLSAVTSLRLDDARIDYDNAAQAFVSCLQRAHRLERLSLSHPLVGPVFSQGHGFSHLHLKFLSLVQNDDDNKFDESLIPLATMVLFPNLEELRLSGPQISWPKRAAYLAALARTSPRISVLHLSSATDMTNFGAPDTTGVDVTLPVALSLLRHLRVLVFHTTQFYTENLKSFCRVLSDGRVCRDLRRVEFSRGCGFLEGSRSPLADMVEARMNASFLEGGPLALEDVVIGCAIDEEVALRIRTALSAKTL